jgi:hypothetical protein
MSNQNAAAADRREAKIMARWTDALDPFSPVSEDGHRRPPAAYGPPRGEKNYAALLPSWRLASNRNQVRRSVSSMKTSSRLAVPESS